MGLKEARERIREIDEAMAQLFISRMKAAGEIAEYKREHGLPVEDEAQEQRVIEECGALVDDAVLRSYYLTFLQNTMDVSKKWQHRLMDGLRVAYCCTGTGENLEAVRSIFPEALAISFDDYASAYAAAESGDCDAAVLPFENGYGGEVGRVIDLIFSGNLHINSVYDIDDNARQKADIMRYAVLSRVENRAAVSQDRSAFLLMFTVNDEAGGLAKAINIISAFDYNMRVLRSRPMKDLQWHYYFYAEAVGDDMSENGERMLNALKVSCPVVKVVGRYPAESPVIRINR